VLWCRGRQGRICLRQAVWRCTADAGTSQFLGVSLNDELYTVVVTTRRDSSEGQGLCILSVDEAAGKEAEEREGCSSMGSRESYSCGH